MNTIKAGAFIADSAILEDQIQIGHNAVILSGTAEKITKVCYGVVIGSNSTIYEGVTIGSKAVVRPGSVVNRSVPPLAVVEGNPAKIVGYVETSTSQVDTKVDRAPLPGVTHTSVNGVNIHNLPNVPDIRGNLTVGEFEKQIPFSTNRYFLIYDVPTAETRGEHAHIECHQFLIAVKGTVHVVADDGSNREEFVLDRPSMGIHLPPMTWGIQYRYSNDAVLLVFASHYYDSADYIRNYDEFVSTKKTILTK